MIPTDADLDGDGVVSAAVYMVNYIYSSFLRNELFDICNGTCMSEQCKEDCASVEGHFLLKYVHGISWIFMDMKHLVELPNVM